MLMQSDDVPVFYLETRQFGDLKKIASITIEVIMSLLQDDEQSESSRVIRTTWVFLSSFRRDHTTYRGYGTLTLFRRTGFLDPMLPTEDVEGESLIFCLFSEKILKVPSKR